tara:strand:- start:1869 stop:2033 length:165 start_codon:yes stop_codon:yes gene_type:complete
MNEATVALTCSKYDISVRSLTQVVGTRVGSKKEKKSKNELYLSGVFEKGKIIVD